MIRSERSQTGAPALTLDEALDEALEDTFPASDAINLHQWTEMKHGTEMKHADPVPQPKSSPPLFDRLATYLLGPTAFCA